MWRPNCPRFKPRAGRAKPAPGWISDPNQQELAEVLTEPRRRGTATNLTAEDVARRLHWSESKAHRVRRALASHRDVAQFLLSTDGQITFVVLADAVALAFPYLIERRPEP